MTTNAPQPTNDDLEHKIDEIKSVLGIRTTTSSSALDDIRDQLNRVEHQLADSRRRQQGSTIFVFSASVAVSGLVLMASQTAIGTKPWQVGLGFLTLGLAFCGFIYYQYFREGILL